MVRPDFNRSVQTKDCNSVEINSCLKYSAAKSIFLTLEVNGIRFTAKKGGGGSLLFEHGHDQAQTARALLKGAGYADVFSACDLAGIERVSGGRLTLAGASR